MIPCTRCSNSTRNLPCY